MNKEQFWSLIDEARNETLAETDDIEEMAEPLTEKLSQLNYDQIIKWDQIFGLYQKLSYKDKLWAADSVINDGLSDDGFDYFRAWITAHGKGVFLSALRDPDSLADLNPKRLETWCEGLIYVSADAYSEKHRLENGMDISHNRYYDECARHALTAEEISEIEAEIVYADNMVSADESDFAWEDNADMLKEMLPRLSKMFG